MTAKAINCLATNNAFACSLRGPRNYTTVSKLLHQRLQLLEEASQQLVAERSHVAECQSQLEVTITRAEKAEQQLQHGVHLPDQLQQLQQQVDKLRGAREEEYQQRVALQEQLGREGRAATSQLHALRDVLARSSAQQQDMEKQLSALKARAKAAEEEAEASQARCKQLQQELTNAKGGQANNALRLLDLQTSQQLLDEKLTRTSSALAQEQAARAEADKQVLALRTDLVNMLHRAEAAEAAATAAAVSASQAEHRASEARAAQLAAEEAHKTADAATKLITQRLTEAQQQAAEERAIAEATQHELQQQLADKDTALQQQRQHEQSWRFRQLEASTRALATLEHLQGRVDALDAAATSYATAVQQQHDSQHSELEGQMSRLTAWEATAEELSGMGSRINTALVHMAQQWVAKQQKLRSSDKGMQMLQTQVAQLEQQLSMAVVMERKLQSELADVQAAREKDQAEAAHEVSFYWLYIYMA
ncbi:hypothetical protein OEZ86_011804 [Tetradesmus obliquus]|nr:hypothetical protein OEZ86_011804 [Tetradesmus obliquus]